MNEHISMSIAEALESALANGLTFTFKRGTQSGTMLFEYTTITQDTQSGEITQIPVSFNNIPIDTFTSVLKRWIHHG